MSGMSHLFHKRELLMLSDYLRLQLCLLVLGAFILLNEALGIHHIVIIVLHHRHTVSYFTLGLNQQRHPDIYNIIG